MPDAKTDARPGRRGTVAWRLGSAAAPLCISACAGIPSIFARAAAGGAASGAPGPERARHPAAPLLERYCLPYHSPETQTEG